MYLFNLQLVINLAYIIEYTDTEISIEKSQHISTRMKKKKRNVFIYDLRR